jgi:hypothetical protein
MAARIAGRYAMDRIGPPCCQSGYTVRIPATETGGSGDPLGMPGLELFSSAKVDPGRC